MRHARFVFAIALTALATLPLVAQDAARPGAIEIHNATAVRQGTAPTLDVLLKRLPETPALSGLVYEVPNITIVPEIAGRPPFVTLRDPLAAPPNASRAPGALLSFDGYSNADNQTVNGFQVSPPDVEGDVGLTFYVQYNNLGFSIFRKSDGVRIAGPTVGNVFWQGFGGFCQNNNAGDPIVLFDHLAQQWVFSQFTSPNNADGHQCFAISQGSDPRGPYFLYDFLVSPGQFNDYPKISVWSDGAGQSAYHMTTNEFQANFVGVNATAFERDAMLTGAPAQSVRASLPGTLVPLPIGIQPAHLEGPAPPAGTCDHYVQAIDDEALGPGGTPDGYQFWRFCVNWANPASSTFTTGPLVQTSEFDAELCAFNRNCIPQAGTTTGLDPIGQFTMYRFQNRFFPGVGLRGVVNHTVDVGANRAGVRWAQFTLPASLSAITLDDTGTFAPVDDRSRFMGSIAMDSAGNIGLSYSRSGATDFPGVFFTGRETADPAGTLQAESTCVAGTGAQTGSNRWGDYSTISVDPVDECTFWLTHEYIQTTGAVSWQTRICSFRFPSCGAPSGDVAFASGTAIGDQATANGFRTVAYGAGVTFTNPIVVMGPPSFNGSQPTSVRVRNVGASSFEYQIEEWDYLDQTHISENIGFLAVEAGRGTLGGLAIEAGAVTANHNWVSVSFSSPFPTAPVVVAQATTRNGGQAITRRIRSVTTTGFQVRVQEEEGNDGSHANETVHWIAIEPGSGTATGGIPIRVASTANAVTQAFFSIAFGATVVNPVLIADMQTFDGADTAALRHRNLSTTGVEVKVEEEQSLNTETNHTTEVVGFIAIGDN